MFEAIGKLVVLGTIIFLIAIYMYRKENTQEQRRKRANLNPRLDKLIEDYQKEVNEGRKPYSKKELNSKINKFLDSYQEIKIYDEKLKDELDRDRERMNALIQNRKKGFKYEEIIFQLFNNDRFLHKNLLYNKIKEYYNVEPDFDPFSCTEEDYAEDILDEWLKHELVQECLWDNNYLEVGYVLKKDCPVNGKDDMTYEDWLKTHSIKFNPYPESYELYFAKFKDSLNPEPPQANT